MTFFVFLLLLFVNFFFLSISVEFLSKEQKKVIETQVYHILKARFELFDLSTRFSVSVS